MAGARPGFCKGFTLEKRMDLVSPGALGFPLIGGVLQVPFASRSLPFGDPLMPMMGSSHPRPLAGVLMDGSKAVRKTDLTCRARCIVRGGGETPAGRQGGRHAGPSPSCPCEMLRNSSDGCAGRLWVVRVSTRSSGPTREP